MVFWITAGWRWGLVCHCQWRSQPEQRPASNLKAAVFEPFLDTSSAGAGKFCHRHGVHGAVQTGDNMATALSTPFYLDWVSVRQRLAWWRKMQPCGLPLLAGGRTADDSPGYQPGAVAVRSGADGQHSGLCLAGQCRSRAVDACPASALVWAWVGTAAFTAFIARESSKTFAATQFALFTALAALLRSLANATTGFIVESMGWGILPALHGAHARHVAVVL